MKIDDVITEGFWSSLGSATKKAAMAIGSTTGEVLKGVATGAASGAGITIPGKDKYAAKNKKIYTSPSVVSNDLEDNSDSERSRPANPAINKPDIIKRPGEPNMYITTAEPVVIVHNKKEYMLGDNGQWVDAFNPSRLIPDPMQRRFTMLHNYSLDLPLDHGLEKKVVKANPNPILGKSKPVSKAITATSPTTPAKAAPVTPGRNKKKRRLR